jgi:hypothetical protein
MINKMGKHVFIALSSVLVLSLLFPACGKREMSGKWKLTLTWNKNASLAGEAAPPAVHILVFKDGKVYKEGGEESGTIKIKGRRIRLRPGKIKIICYGELIDENRMEGRISYFPTSEIYGTWTAVRLELIKKQTR